MNCREAEPLILAERDGVLTPEQHAALAQHVASCTSCRQLQHDLAHAMDAVRAEAVSVRVPEVETEWRAVQARLAAANPARRQPRRLAPIIWITAPLAAAAALALAFLTSRPVAPDADTTGYMAAQADFVEVSDPSATAVVYTDQESGWLVVWAVSTDKASHG